MKALNILYLIIGIAIVLIGIIAVLDGQLIALVNFVIGGYFISDAVSNFYYLYILLLCRFNALQRLV